MTGPGGAGGVILVSACLLGIPTRYDPSKPLAPLPGLPPLLRQGRVLVFCPETAGGLKTPRPAAEITGGDGGGVLDGRLSVKDREGRDVTSAFVRGAQMALFLCRRHDIRIAVLKEGSPSCASTYVYDGSFSGIRRAGMGVTAALLVRNGIRVFSEHTLQNALQTFH